MTASQLNRLLQCPASNCFPAVTSTSEYAERGIVIHQFLERCSTHGRHWALNQVPDEYRATCSRIDVDTLPTKLSAEVAFALDVHTGLARRIERPSYARAYDLRPNEMAGTADVLGRMGTDGVFVADWKTGFKPVAPPRSNPQLLFLALAAARYYNADWATIELIQIRSDGSAYREQALLDLVDLDSFFNRLRWLYMEIADAEALVLDGETPRLNEGPHCDYCPSFQSCPAKVSMVHRIGTGDASTELELLAQTLTPEIAGYAWQQVQSIKRVANRVERMIYALARQQPIPLLNGKELRLVSKEGNERLDGDAAFELMSKQFGRELADEAAARSVSKASILRALETMDIPNPRQQLGWILGRLRDEGATERPIRESVVEVPREQE